MINRIPFSMVSQMGMYDFEIHGTMVKESVDNSSVVDAKIVR